MTQLNKKPQIAVMITKEAAAITEKIVPRTELETNFSNNLSSFIVPIFLNGNQTPEGMDEIIREYEDAFLLAAEDSGVMVDAARNKSIDVASADYIGKMIQSWQPNMM